MEPISFETRPSRYNHIALEIDGRKARLILSVRQDGGLRPGYRLKLNSYDLGVDIELADAVQRLRFEHPEVSVVTLTSGLEDVFCAGANIQMLAGSDHGFKVNFCKFTNETRLAIEEASASSGQHYVAALNGTASGGGYELALACEKIWLVDDRRSAVSLPEVPLLGVLPGTGGLVRIIAKRHVRRDLADLFVTLAEGVRGQRALKWGLVDAIIPRSRYEQSVDERVDRLAASNPRKGVSGGGVPLDELQPSVTGDSVRYRHLTLNLDHARRVAEMVVRGSSSAKPLPNPPSALGADFYPLRLFREIDDVLLRLRFNFPEIGLVLIRSEGDLNRAIALDREMALHAGDWFIRETLLLVRRVLKRMDLTAKSFFALVEEGSCFGGFLLELVLAADRVFMQNRPRVEIATGPLNRGWLAMGSGLSRIEAQAPRGGGSVRKLAAPGRFGASEAFEAGLATAIPDEIDWDDEVRVAIDERLSLSPDALTAVEQILRSPGPETMETKIFGRLAAWQNWVFQRPNAVGEHGALKLYGQPERPRFDWRRT